MKKIIKQMLEKVLTPEQKDALAEIYRRSTLRKIYTQRSSTRGFKFAQTWLDSLPEKQTNDIPSGDFSNPLKLYFDSHTTGKGIWKWIHYFEIYHRHFKKFVGKEVHMVEVGIYSGGSLDMWKNYFGPECRIYGVDIEEVCKMHEDDTTKVFVGDQADRDFWRRFKEQVPRVDILIDDGGHIPEQQIVTLEEMLPHLSAGGVYLCEDVHGTYNRFNAYVHGLADNLNAMMIKQAEEISSDVDAMMMKQVEVVPLTFQKYIHSVHSYPFVTVIEKTESPVDYFLASKHGI